MVSYFYLVCQLVLTRKGERGTKTGRGRLPVFLQRRRWNTSRSQAVDILSIAFTLNIGKYILVSGFS
jgi:hypothetical protein